jgi:ribosomal protein S27E
MEQKPTKLTLYNIEFATTMAKDRRTRVCDLANKITLDQEKKQRLAEALCPLCYYDKSRYGGAAITNRDCAKCGKTMYFGSTCTDVLCLECAKALALCKHCGATINLGRISRKTIETITGV